ncbi:glycosyltransferase family 2 protein [Sedimentimonas flavescens]|uniref:glycosyltransferase family 2 protein n=1 Tax=Sedimentimonas flavescens TaxID=2851012 RepID=UPI0021A7F59B|nr:glycosyltransferase family 2 protein [Sedimentimonas flavescens]MCT2539309.1 glycosyltransferase family 2 protein [Sedimentimonas flavescens]
MPETAVLPSWGVVATIDEPPALAAAFVAHHLAVGAREVHVFLDRPNPETEALLRGVPGVVLRHSGDDGWVRGWKALRPARHETRQKYNATRALAEAGLDWLVHCDADEFVHPHRSFALDLASAGPEKAWIKLEVEERCFLHRRPRALFEGVFRSPWPDFEDDGAEIYGDRARFLNRGVAAHSAGKSCTRAAEGRVIGVHYPLAHWDDSRNTLPYRPSYNARLRHFDGLTPLHYILKMLRRATTEVRGQPIPHGAPRLAQMAAAARRVRNPEGLARLWWKVLGLRKPEAEALEARGMLTRGETGIEATVTELFGARVDLSPAAFDRALVVHQAELIDQLHDRLGFDPAPLMLSSETP